MTSSYFSYPIDPADNKSSFIVEFDEFRRQTQPEQKTFDLKDQRHSREWCTNKEMIVYCFVVIALACLLYCFLTIGPKNDF